MLLWSDLKKLPKGLSRLAIKKRTFYIATSLVEDDKPWFLGGIDIILDAEETEVENSLNENVMDFEDELIIIQVIFHHLMWVSVILFSDRQSRFPRMVWPLISYDIKVDK